MTTNIPEMTMIDDTKLIWAASPKGRYVHIYAGVKGLTAGVPLCGVRTKPTQIYEHFDPENEICHDIACPDCLARLAFAKYMKPVSELYKERNTTEGATIHD